MHCCWLSRGKGIKYIELRAQGMDVSTAFSAFADAPLWSREMMCSMQEASQGKVIGPSRGIPNSSSDNLRSSLKRWWLRYVRGIMKRIPSEEYTKRWPLFATDGLCLSKWGPPLILLDMILLLPELAVFCHFLTICKILLEMKIMGLQRDGWKQVEMHSSRLQKMFCGLSWKERSNRVYK